MTAAVDHPTGTILVTGATGDVGGLLTARLQEVRASVRVMCRRQDQFDGFTARGVEGVLGSFKDPASLRRAMTGCEQGSSSRRARKTS